MIETQSCKNSQHCYDAKTAQNNSCSNFIYEYITQEKKVLSLPMEDSLCDMEYISKFGKLIIDGLLLFDGLLFIVVCIAFYVWFSKYRLRYLLRINFVVFFTLLLDYAFSIYERPFPEQLKNGFDFTCKEYEHGRLSAILLSAFMAIFMLIVRFYWSLPLNIKETLHDYGSSKVYGSVKARFKLSAHQLNQGKLQGEFSYEIPPVFPNGWIPLIESSQILAGSSKTVSAIGNKFCVFRGFEGKSYVLDAYCPHLGAELAAGGRVVKECIECPFHEWQFDGSTGQCVKIPYAKKVPDVARMKTWPSCENNGFIFVWYHAENESPSWSMPSLSEVESGIWKFKGRTEHEVNCHIQEIPENGADVAHLHVIHSKSVFLKQYKLWQLGDFFLDYIKHEWHSGNWEQDKENPHIGIIKLSQTTRLCGYNLPYSKLSLNIKQIGPATVHLHIDTDFGKGVLVQHIIPEGPLNHRIIHLLYTEAWFPQFAADLLIQAESIMIGRDIAIWNNKRFLKNPLLVKEDTPIKYFRKCYIQYYSENSLTLRDIEERSLEW